MTNSMNKACQRFEAWGNAQLEPAGIPVGKICQRTVMSVGRRKPPTANSCRKTACIKRYNPSGRNNRRPFIGQPVYGKNPVGYRFGRRYDTGMPPNASCLEPEKSGYNGRSWYSSRMAESTNTYEYF